MAKKTPDGDSREIFSKERADLGIKAACDAFDELDLTLFERWWAARSVELAAGSILGPKMAEWVEKNADKLSIEPHEPVGAGNE